jgi:hypothetical protein
MLLFFVNAIISGIQHYGLFPAAPYSLKSHGGSTLAFIVCHCTGGVQVLLWLA